MIDFINLQLCFLEILKVVVCSSASELEESSGKSANCFCHSYSFGTGPNTGLPKNITGIMLCFYLFKFFKIFLFRRSRSPYVNAAREEAGF